MSSRAVTRKFIVVAIALGVGALHFVTGSGYRGPFPNFVNGYMIDILLPFAMYLILGVANWSPARPVVVRGLLVFGIGAISETMQYFGVPIFGRTFDPADYLMFALGVGLGVAFEQVVLSRMPIENSMQSGTER